MKVFVFIFLLLWTSPGLLSLAYGAPVTLEETMQGQAVGSAIEYLIDNTHKLQFEDLKSQTDSLPWQALPGKFHNFGHIQGTVWFRLTLDNSHLPQTTVFLENNYALMDQLTLQFPKALGGKLITLGDRLPFRAREIAYRNPVFVLEIPPGSYTFFGRIETTDLSTFAFRLWDPASFRAMQNMEQLALGLLFGVMLAFLFYHLILYATTRMLLFKPYCFYIASFILVEFSLVGLSQQVIPVPSLSLWLSNTGFHVFLITGLYSALGFLGIFLDLAKEKPRWNKSNIFFKRSLIGILLYKIAGLPQAGLLISVLLSLCSVHFLLCCIFAVKEGHRPARFLLAAWLVLGLGSGILGLADLGLIQIDIGQAIIYHFSAGSLEMILLSIAIGDWWRVDRARRRQESEQAQALAQAIQKKRDHAFDQLKKIVYPHQLDMIIDGRQLEKTMPVGKGTAAVLAFDVVASSKVKHDLIQEFFRYYFAQCYDIMIENYEPQEMQANAYRIKETGDGFLCSVGYPFKPADKQAPAPAAVALAERLIALFYQCLLAYPSLHDLRCCIGIGMDRVESYFPEHGARVYDLYGRAIILANRYEALRKESKIFDGSHSYIILQERVYRHLSPEAQAKFKSLDLVNLHIQVRDDAEARLCYYQQLPHPALKVA